MNLYQAMNDVQQWIMNVIQIFIGFCHKETEFKKMHLKSGYLL